MQTSFKKKPRASAATTVIPGTQPSLHNGQLLCSTGVPSLDAVIGGGIPVGSVLMLEEDANAQYSNLLTRYFMAEGVMCGHELLIVSNEEKSSLLDHLPEPVLMNDDPDKELSGSEMKIAWRYQGNPQVQTSMGKSSKYGHYYDISKLMSSVKLKSCKTALINLKDAYCKFDKDEAFDVYKYALKELHKYMMEHNFDIQTAVRTERPMNILRIAIPNFSSPFWGCERHKIMQFLSCLRTILRNSLAVCFLTAPTHIHSPCTVQLIRHGVDAVIKLDAFGSGKTNPLYKEYHGGRCNLLCELCKSYIYEIYKLAPSGDCTYTEGVTIHDPGYDLTVFEVTGPEQTVGDEAHSCLCIFGQLEACVIRPKGVLSSGLLKIEKLPALNSLLPFMPDTLDLAFKLRRKKFCVERLHLPPDIGETASRQDGVEDETRLQMSCSSGGGGGGKSSMDF